MDVLFKTVGDIPEHALVILMILFLLEIWGYVIVLVRIAVLKLNRVAGVGCVILIMANYFVLECLINIKAGSDHTSRNVSALFKNIPFGLLAGITVATFLALMIIIRTTVIIIKNSVTTESIKAGFDNLPLGIAFYLDNGLVRMVNKEMIEITRVLTGDTLRDGLAFKKQIMEGRVNACLVEAGDQPIFRLDDGRYISFAFSEIKFENKTANKITETDITERYLLNLQLESENKAQENANRHLSELNKTIRDVTIQKEELEAKIKIHDNLGQAGVVALRYLNGEPNEIEKKKLYDLWIENINFLTHQETNDDKDMIGDILETAENVGVSVIISGEISDNESYKYILSKALHECLTNTIRHGKGDRMDLILDRDDRDYRIRITNNGIPPKGKIKATGGLGTLREIVNTAGGSMKILSSPRFELIIRIPIGE